MVLCNSEFVLSNSVVVLFVSVVASVGINRKPRMTCIAFTCRIMSYLVVSGFLLPNIPAHILKSCF